MSAADTTKEQELKKLKQQISNQKSLLQKQKKQQSSLSTALRAVETDIAKAAKALYKTNQQLKSLNEQQQQLVAQQEQLSKQKLSQQQALSKQIKSAYMTGNNNLLQLILNQQKSSETQRLLGYYHFLNKARIESIAKVKETLAQLTQVNLALQENKQKLTAVKQHQLAHENTLASEKLTRAKALKKLNQSYQKNSVRLEQFQLSELDIKQIIEQSKQAKLALAKPITLDGLTKLKRKLPRPTSGKVLHRFGTKRHGRLLWKGITIAGQEGQGINAIHDGKVIFSDWIKGFGLVLVLDHGKGYMSLYGHNQALLKNAGDSVSANERIALLGQSGGQNQSSLYFEIRYKGTAINPSQWLKKS